MAIIHTRCAWIICTLKSLHSNVSKIVKILHSVCLDLLPKFQQNVSTIGHISVTFYTSLNQTFLITYTGKFLYLYLHFQSFYSFKNCYTIHPLSNIKFGSYSSRKVHLYTMATKGAKQRSRQ